jgi:hypothetical protein
MSRANWVCVVGLARSSGIAIFMPDSAVGVATFAT